MSVRHALLALLSEGPKYGLQLRQEFEARTGEVWPLNVGQVYTTLQRLERDGLVESDDSAEEGPQKGFHITQEGADELRPVAADPARLLVATAGRAGDQGAGRPRAPRGGRTRGRPGAPALPRRADAAVDAPEGGRVTPRPQLRAGGRRRAVPARLVDPVAGHGRRSSEASGGGRRCAGAHVVPPPESPTQGGSPAMSYLELRNISKVYGEGATEVHALQHIELNRSRPDPSWPSWAPAVRARARC